MKVIITKELESFWGVEDIVSEGMPPEDTEKAIIELLNEDLAALLDNAQWEIVYD